MSKINKSTISAKVPSSIKKKFEDYAEGQKKSSSHYFRMALYLFLDMKDEIEIDDNSELILENINRYNQSELEQEFLEYENQIISQEIKKATFVRFMDNFLAEIWLKNEQYVKTGEFTESDVIHLMKDGLSELENRAEHHGFEKSFNARMNEPKKYARERINYARNHYSDDLDADVPDLSNGLDNISELEAEPTEGELPNAE